MIRRLGTGSLLLCLAIGAYVMLVDFFNLRRALDAETPESLSVLNWPQPWGGYAWRDLVITSGADWRIAPDTVAQLIDAAATRYPIDAGQWLDRARISVDTERSRDVDVLLQKALASRPLHRPTLWTAAQIALQTGDARLAERQLRQWLKHYPNDTGRAMFIGKRWISEPSELLDRMLPPQREYLEEAMRVSLRQENLRMAEAVWRRLDPKPNLDDPVFLHYIELLLRLGRVDQAVELWRERDSHWHAGMLVNGNFSRELGQALGLNWRTDRAPAGVRIERDRSRSFTEPASLRIDFNGKENVNLNAPWIRIPAQPGQRYRLSGVWSAEGLTTRALPYLQLTAEGTRSLREIVELPRTRFEWAPWSIEFLVPEDTRLLRLFVRRESTQAFDRNIDGTLWLDHFELALLADEERSIDASPPVSEPGGR